MFASREKLVMFSLPYRNPPGGAAWLTLPSVGSSHHAAASHPRQNIPVLAASQKAFPRGTRIYGAGFSFMSLYHTEIYICWSYIPTTLTSDFLPSFCSPMRMLSVRSDMGENAYNQSPEDLRDSMRDPTVVWMRCKTTQQFLHLHCPDKL